MIAKNQLMDITEYMDTVASETKEVVGEDFLKAKVSTDVFMRFPH